MLHLAQCVYKEPIFCFSVKNGTPDKTDTPEADKVAEKLESMTVKDTAEKKTEESGSKKSDTDTSKSASGDSSQTEVKDSAER